MFKIVKSCKKLIFRPVKHEKFLLCLAQEHDLVIPSGSMQFWGSFHYWESELTFGNLTNFWKLANHANQKVS